ncbi:hypothetical protein KOW79_021959 [Hemibagrus wyckioides]|uniref:Uncharacterized protein n=1 Tax=Hemibagrus wyckioides TaxID=337641 RepID=A0A9D3N274_9TELE|nr:hypothetical protein KOW79_021959 [Hemibagrus wyckioides]
MLLCCWFTSSTDCDEDWRTVSEGNKTTRKTHRDTQQDSGVPRRLVSQIKEAMKQTLMKFNSVKTSLKIHSKPATAGKPRVTGNNASLRETAGRFLHRKFAGFSSSMRSVFSSLSLRRWI